MRSYDVTAQDASTGHQETRIIESSDLVTAIWKAGVSSGRGNGVPSSIAPRSRARACSSRPISGSSSSSGGTCWPTDS